MAIQLSTATWSQGVDLVNRVYTKSLESYDYVLKNSGLVRVDSMALNAGQFKRLSEMPVTTRFASIKDEGAPVASAAFQLGYEKDLQIVRFGLSITITREERIQNKNPEVVQKLLNIARAVPERMELDLAHRIGFGAATSYVEKDGKTIDISLGDGFQLFYSAHTVTGSSTTYRNRLAADPAFSKGSLEAMQRLISEETFDNLGQKVNLNFDIVWSTDDKVTQNRIDEELNAKADTTSSNAGTFNVNYKSLRRVSSPYIATTATGAVDTTKRRYWGIASSEMTDLYLCTLEAPSMFAPADGNNGEDFRTSNWSYKTEGSYGIATVTGRWIKASLPTS
jgi:hypothetical protein